MGVPRLEGGVTNAEGESLAAGNLNEPDLTGVEVEDAGRLEGNVFEDTSRGMEEGEEAIS